MTTSHEFPSSEGDNPMQSKERLIKLDRSIIPACDVSDLETFEKLVRETADVPGIGGYKIGAELVIPYGGVELVKVAREHTDKPLIYDHQKAGNDIPDTTGIIKSVARSGFDAVILFPFTSPITQEKWTKASIDHGLTVLVGGEMTHEKFLESEGGYIADSAPERIYRFGAEMGVRNFVVPGNKIEKVQKYRALLEEMLGEGNFALYAPGFVAQGGNIAETGQAAGSNWHAIVGRGIFAAEDMRQAAIEMTSGIK